MTHLVADIGERSPCVYEQTAEAMSKIVKPDETQTSALQKWKGLGTRLLISNTAPTSDGKTSSPSILSSPREKVSEQSLIPQFE